MAGTSGARRFTEADKAHGLTVLAANDGNIKRTSRDLGVNTATLRRWREQARHGDGPSEALVIAAVGEFVTDAKRIRNKALMHLEALIDAGKVPPAVLNNIMGTLDDKIRLAQNMPTSRVEQTSAIPDRETLKELMGAAIQGAIEAAEKRHDIIVEAEVVPNRPSLSAVGK